jgi:hypothetical protein
MGAGVGVRTSELQCMNYEGDISIYRIRLFEAYFLISCFEKQNEHM